ncbi:Mu transposase, C-terminal [Andreprevotia lacus DSM 23236]|jgi:hypothetical protein|uniref:Mu transposase, C-terminal n=1 Tax=Andreprevotia lacus DSM 23236 TaxID=1121001 RepID=A0A1W1X2K0_9NEIS|nr:Mu transposase C-terminal domain-containing protein [Andreprevotia lacus]SMC18172.1 Mu transposase, C-terminal [Andreprevotia lacus DSM 23236]
MLLRNDLIHYQDRGNTLRVLAFQGDDAKTVLIDIHDAAAQPFMEKTATLHADLESGAASLLSNDPLLRILDERSIPIKQVASRDRAWQIIEPLVRTPEIFLRSERGKLVTAAVHEHKVTVQSVYRYLRRYWQRGQTPNALLPDYCNSGAPGKTRRSTPGVKRGRPRKFVDSTGINVTPEMLQIFAVAIQRYYAGERKRSLVDAYDDMIRQFFLDQHRDAETGEVHHRFKDGAEDGQPTFAQFNYWYEKQFSRFAIKRARVGAKIYDKDLRGILGSSTARETGPGSRYQIDATIADVYLVSRLDRKKIIGRPVLYVVIDVFSRMVVGIYIGLEGPSWVGAMMALANAAGDKVTYCQRYGVEISAADWPCHYLPETLLGDRGEIASRYIDNLANSFNIDIENASSYRADWKGIVEQRFKLIPAKFKPYVPGYIEPDFGERGARDYRLDAILDLDAFTQIVIECLLYYNNYHELKKYDADRSVVADNVPRIPIELWDWGIANQSGSLRAFPEERVKFQLLPTGKASVTAQGIKFKNAYYTCSLAVEQYWFDQARQSRWRSIEISYDPRDIEVIYFLDKASNSIQACHLTDRSRADRGLSEWEVEQQAIAAKRQSQPRKREQVLAQADLTAAVERVVKASREKSGDVTHSASSIRAIRSNRAQEKASNRQEETFRLGATPSSHAKAKVVPLRPTSNDYAEPSIAEILGEDDDHD